MKRALLLSVIILTVDQLLKLYFQLYFLEEELLIFKHWGFTYVTNLGIWISPDISMTLMIIIQIFVILCWLLMLKLLTDYHIYYRKSIFIDISFAFFTTAALGNVILDRLFLGYIRDYFITPIAICNLADISFEISLIFFVIELIRYPDARNIF